MTNFKKYPSIFSDSFEEQVLKKFVTAMGSQASKFMRVISEREDAVMGFDDFKSEVLKYSKGKLQSEDIDCAFVILSRGTLTYVKSQVDAWSSEMLAEKSMGFDTQNIHMLFKNGPIQEEASIDEDNYSDDFSQRKPT